MSKKKTEINPICKERLKEALRQNGYSVAKLVKESSFESEDGKAIYSEKHISGIVTGKIAMPETLARYVSNKFSEYPVRFEYLMGYDDSRTEEERIQFENEKRSILEAKSREKNNDMLILDSLFWLNGYKVSYSYPDFWTEEESYIDEAGDVQTKVVIKSNDSLTDEEKFVFISNNSNDSEKYKMTRAEAIALSKHISRYAIFMAEEYKKGE